MIRNGPTTTTTTMGRRQPTTGSPPTPINHGNFRFLITDQPTDRTLGHYLEMLKQHHCVRLVRACDNNQYDVNVLQDVGIQTFDLDFDDGAPPPGDVLKRWLDLMEAWFIVPSPEHLAEDERVAIHCVAGLGRGPVLVVIALIEDGMEPLEAAQFVRSQRKGALNTAQLRWIESYTKTREKKWKRLRSGKPRNACQLC
ncbi:hypothetical protein BASA81_005167 [Batrachochytrium salamandrivorans]|nr:hypothetical protein BASA81_005167 [Batrachochytrium salamandrivorans]